MTDPKPPVEPDFDDEGGRRDRDSACVPPRFDSGGFRRGVEGLLRPLTVWRLAAVCVVVGLMAACGVGDGSEGAVSKAEEVAPETAPVVTQAGTPTDSPSSAVGPSTDAGQPVTVGPSTDAGQPVTVGPSAPETAEAPEVELETPRLQDQPVVASEGPSDGGGPATLDREPPQSEEVPQFLHVDIDGDNAVIISGPGAETAQDSVVLHGEDSPAAPTPSRGARFIWHDGDREAPVWQDTVLTVADVLPEGGWDDPSGPVFWSESNELMALPGGVILTLDPAWDAATVEAFMSSNSIGPSQAEAFEGLANWFKVETDPGFPSLRLANSLAGQSGVVISSPNWWIRGLVE